MPNPTAQPRPPNYEEAEATQWLSWIARGMQEHGQYIFLIEALRPTWFDKAWQRWLNFFVVHTSVGLLWGLLIGAFFETVRLVIAQSAPRQIITQNGFWLWIILVPIWTLGVGIIDEARRRSQMRGSPRLDRGISEVVGRYFVYLFLWIAIFSLTLLWTWPFIPGGSVESLREAGRLVHPILPGILAAWLLALADARRSVSGGASVEALGWSWRPALLGATAGVAVGMGIWFTRQLLAEAPLPLYLTIGIAFGTLFGGLTGRIPTGKTEPNQGVRLSAKNALTVGLGAAILLATCVRLLWESLVDVGFVLENGSGRGPICFGLIAFVAVAYFYGGLEVFKHYVLRAILVFGGGPARIRRFLDYAVGRTFLRRMGGGYMFRHRVLLEHFAELSGPASLSEETG